MLTTQNQTAWIGRDFTSPSGSPAAHRLTPTVSPKQGSPPFSRGFALTKLCVEISGMLTDAVGYILPFTEKTRVRIPLGTPF